jgi:medium-chain acyl-[acyl-carrier-protein] hydrolase
MTGTTLNDAWVLCPKPNPQARLRLFCFPYAGGGASRFRLWPDFLPPEVEVCAIQYPGREARLGESPFTQLSPLVQTLASALRLYLNLPFVFFGHSLGALACFELARQLRRQGQPEPLHLFVSGRRAPQVPNPDPPQGCSVLKILRVSLRGSEADEAISRRQCGDCFAVRDGS